ncbi:unnamed protein product [Pieris brassicae]|uniref:Uncharacterized protein n=1 Tax=Pieris brassicae TaxID=7116 RepID=A0A9P0TEP6_PIEBR|nr:unnamed protein product [Pieris brassicae]
MNCAQDTASNCRCKSVQKWLDNHEKYFVKPSTSEARASSSLMQNVSPFIAHQNYGPRHVHYGITGDIQYTEKVVRLPYTMQPPFRVSPIQPPKP